MSRGHPMGAVEAYLVPEERVVFETRLHPAVFGGALGFAAFVGGVVALVIARNPLTGETVRTLLLVGAGVAACAFVAPAVRWRTSRFAVTTRRVLVTTGLFRNSAIELPHGEGRVDVQLTLAGRWLGFGTVHLDGLIFPRVADAVALGDAVRRLVPQAMRPRSRGH